MKQAAEETMPRVRESRAAASGAPLPSVAKPIPLFKHLREQRHNQAGPNKTPCAAGSAPHPTTTKITWRTTKPPQCRLTPQSPDLRRACSRLHGILRDLFLHPYSFGLISRERGGARLPHKGAMRPAACHGAPGRRQTQPFTWHTELLLLATITPTAFRLEAAPSRAERPAGIDPLPMNQRGRAPHAALAKNK